MSRVIRGMSIDRQVRFLVVDSSELVQKAASLHKTLPTATAAFGRTLTAAVILGKLLKSDNEKITLQIKGDGPIGSILCVTTASGNVKGYVKNPFVDLPPTEEGKLNVGGAVGKGEIIVIKDFGLKDQFVGRTPLVNGEIGDDLASYFMVSEQQPSIVSLGVYVDERNVPVYSGGMLIQPMPYADDSVIDRLEEIVTKLEPMTTLLRAGLSPEQIIERSLQGFEIEVLDENKIDFICDCSKDRIESALMTIGKKEIEEILHDDGKAELQCHFCNKIYDFDKKELEDILAKLECN